MGKQYKDILLGTDYTPIVKDGDFAVGECLDQEVDIILKLSQGQWRSNPLLGPGLFRFVNGAIQAEDLIGVVQSHLSIDGKSGFLCMLGNNTVDCFHVLESPSH